MPMTQAKPISGTLWLSGYMFFPVAPVAGDHIETTPGQTLQVEGRELKLDGRIELYVGRLDGWTRESAIAEFDKLPGYVITTTP